MTSIQRKLRLFLALGAGISLCLSVAHATLYLNFDSINATTGAVDAVTYLRSYGVTLTNVNPAGSIVVFNDTKYYNGGAVTASSPHNFLTQSVGGSPNGITYTMLFGIPLQSVTFTRCAIGINAASAAWTATAYAGTNAVGSVGDPYIDGDTGTSAEIYTLTGPGITSLTITASGNNFTANSSVPLDDFYLVPVIPGIHTFSGADGAEPESGPAQTTDGILYGTTAYGGQYSYGSVYQITTNGIFSTIFSFTNETDGTNPWPGLAPGTNGFLYGTAGGGNYYNQYNIYGGVIYRISTNGTYTGLHTFAFPTDGALPGPLVKSSAGSAFFGATQIGGTNLDAEDQYGNVIGCGTIFRINTNGTFSTVFSFGGTNGAGPAGPLLRATDNHLYGMAAGGTGFAGLNTGSIASGNGTIFKVETNGVSYTNLVFFNITNGANPDHNGLVQTPDGELFGTTRGGGANNNGTVFAVSTNGVFENLYSFTGGNDGAQPDCTLVYASDGNLYGTTYSGGTNNLGTIFEIGTNGVLNSLFSFNGTNGAYPEGALLGAKDGNIYGATVGDVTNTAGTVFTYSPALPPVIINQPAGTNVVGGVTATFGVGALGALPLHYQWQSNSVALPKQTNATLNVVSVTTNSQANYSVVITNLYGSVTSSPAPLIVVGIPPSITNQPQSEIVSNNGTATFTVGASGSPRLFYQWQTNGVNLAKATNATLTLTTVKTNNAGNYTVIVTNLYGSVTSAVAVLTVGSYAPTIISSPTDFTAGAGGPASFTVTASGTIPLTYQWQINGTNLTDGGEISGSQTSTLAFNTTTTNDAADYSVIVTNFYGSATSSVASLSVVFPFVIVGQPQDETVTNGLPATFSVAVNGTGPFSYKWQKNGIPLADGANISGSATSNLTINAAAFADQGYYSVYITNGYGNLVSAGAALSVVLIGPNTITFNADATVILAATENISSDTIVDGNGYNVTISGNNNCGVFFANPGVHLTLQNLTVANGLALGGYGGGIDNSNGIVTINNCTFSNNVAMGTPGGNGEGGAIYNGAAGTLVVNNSTFFNNNASGGFGQTGGFPGGTGYPGGSGYGGAISSENVGTVTITNCTFYDNQAHGGQGGQGGDGENGYYYCCDYYEGRCVGECLQSGSPGGYGGNGGTGYGGSVANINSTMTIINSTLANGHSYLGAGGFPGYNGSFSSGNPTDGFHGYAYGGNIAMVNGGCTLKNSIVASGTSQEFGSMNSYNAGNFVDAGNNLSSDPTLPLTNPTSITNVNPILDSLASNGGPTLTMALLSSSPAIRAGDTNGTPLTDQRGFPRKPLFIDLGAYETQVITSTIPPVIIGAMASGTNQLQLTFSNTPGDTFSVWSSTNLLLPFADWTWLGFAREIAPGQFLFNGPNFTNSPQAFFRVSSP
jgi:uncharacterized repeat protein (TIGR03803 family)